MRPGFQVTALLLIILSMLSSCATTGKKPSPEESLLASLAKLGEAIAAKNPEAVLDLLAPAFYHPQIGHRDDAFRMMTMTLDSGFSGGFVLDTSALEYEMDKKIGRAHLSLLALKGNGREYQLDLDMVQVPEDDTWRVLGFQLK